MDSGKIYFLDLPTLLTYLQGQSCTLFTETRIAKKNAQGRISIQAGRIIGCQLDFADGRQLWGEAAYEHLKTCEQWQVQLEAPGDPRKPPHSPPRQAPSAPEPPRTIPLRGPASPLKIKRHVNPGMFQNLPAKESLIVRTILTLINGRSTSEEIRAQLHLTPEEMDTALHRLRLLDLIE